MTDETNANWLRRDTPHGRLDNELEDVRAFQQKFGQLCHATPGHLTKRKLKERVEFLLEELREFADAAGLIILGADGSAELSVELNEFDHDQELPLQADALVDLVYVAKGTAVMLGLPWGELWDDVQRANLAKERGVGPRGHLVDCVKPPGWEPPKTELILAQAGYTAADWTHPETGLIDEEVCRDDAVHRS